MSQDQPFIWKSSLGGPRSWGGWSLRGSLRQGRQCYRLMESQLWGGGVQKRDNGLPFCLGEDCPPPFSLMPDTSVSPSMPLVPFKLLPHCWSSEGMSQIKSMSGFFKRNCLGFQKFHLLTHSPLVFAFTSYVGLPFWHWNPGLGTLV